MSLLCSLRAAGRAQPPWSYGRLLSISGICPRYEAAGLGSKHPGMGAGAKGQGIMGLSEGYPGMGTFPALVQLRKPRPQRMCLGPSRDPRVTGKQAGRILPSHILGRGVRTMSTSQLSTLLPLDPKAELAPPFKILDDDMATVFGRESFRWAHSRWGGEQREGGERGSRVTPSSLGPWGPSPIQTCISVCTLTPPPAAQAPLQVEGQGLTQGHYGGSCTRAMAMTERGHELF